MATCLRLSCYSWCSSFCVWLKTIIASNLQDLCPIIGNNCSPMAALVFSHIGAAPSQSPLWTAGTQCRWGILNIMWVQPLDQWFLPVSPQQTECGNAPWPLWWRPSRPCLAARPWCSSCSPPATAGSPSWAWMDTLGKWTHFKPGSLSATAGSERVTLPLVLCVLRRRGGGRSLGLFLLIGWLFFLAGCLGARHLQQGGLSLKARKAEIIICKGFNCFFSSSDGSSQWSSTGGHCFLYQKVKDATLLSNNYFLIIMGWFNYLSCCINEHWFLCKNA